MSAAALDSSSRPAWRTRAWGIVAALSITETVSWGILYYAFAAFLVPMQRDLGYSAAQLTGAFSLALGIAAVAGIGVGRYLDRRSPRGLMTVGSIAGTALVWLVTSRWTRRVLPALGCDRRRPGHGALLGMGNGMATLARATSIADRYGAAAYGTIASVAGGMTTAARAAGPFLAALYLAAVGYTTLLWTLAALALAAAALALRVETTPVKSGNAQPS